MAWPIRILLATAVPQLCTALSGILRNREESASMHMLALWAGADSDSQAPCEDAAEGSSCFNTIMWLNIGGFNEHLSWRPEHEAESLFQDVQAMLKNSLFQDVQAMLNSSGRSHCPRPCATTSATSLLQDAGTVSREVPGGGKTRGSGLSCHDAETGEFCYRAVRWLMAEGIASHPEWYPALDANSTVHEVQNELNRKGKGQCPRPCWSEPSAEGEPEGVEEPVPRSPEDALGAGAAQPDLKSVQDKLDKLAKYIDELEKYMSGKNEGVVQPDHPSKSTRTNLLPNASGTHEVQEEPIVDEAPDPDFWEKEYAPANVSEDAHKPADASGEEQDEAQAPDPDFWEKEHAPANVSEEAQAVAHVNVVPPLPMVDMDAGFARARADVTEEARASAGTSGKEQAPANVSEEAQALAGTSEKGQALADPSAEEQAPSNVSEGAQAVAHVNVVPPLPMVDMDAGFAHAPADVTEEAQAAAGTSGKEQAPANVSEEAQAPAGTLETGQALADTSAEDEAPSNVSEEAQSDAHVKVASPLPMVDMDADAVHAEDELQDVANETVSDSSSQGVADVTAPGVLTQEAANANASDSVSQQAANVTASASVSQEAANVTASDALQSVSQETATVTAASGSVSQKVANYTASDFAAVAATVDVKATESDANIVEEGLPMIGQDGGDMNDVDVPARTSPTAQPVDEVTNVTAQMPMATDQAETAARMDAWARRRAKERQAMETTTTARVETEAEVEARIRSEVMNDMADTKSQLESTTTAHVETAAELEDRLVSEAMKDMADAKPRLESTTTVHVETVEEIQARIHAKLMQDMENNLATKAKKRGSRRTPGWAHHVQSRIKAKKDRNAANQVRAAAEMEATTTTRVETEDEMEARIRSEVVKQYIAGVAKPRLESTTTSHVETAAEMEARIEDKLIKDMLAAQPQLGIEDKMIKDILAAQP